MDLTSTGDFMEKCLNNPLLKNDGIEVFYRGINDGSRPETHHIPGLYHPSHKFYEHEDDIFREAISIFPDEMLAQRSTIEKLFIMQHYRFPTRIMDISKNPLTGLFFACFADKGQDASLKKDGVVYVYGVPKKEIKFTDSDTVSVLANLCKRPNTFSVKGLTRLSRDEFNDEEAIGYLVYDIQEEKPHFHPLIQPDAINSVVCLRPRMNNPRIIRQDGSFFLFGIDGEKKNCAKIPPEWIKAPVIIPAERKKAILAELDKMDLNEGFFYADFEHVSSVIRHRYGKK
jgi:hypothetical protein